MHIEIDTNQTITVHTPDKRKLSLGKCLEHYRLELNQGTPNLWAVDEDSGITINLNTVPYTISGTTLQDLLKKWADLRNRQKPSQDTPGEAGQKNEEVPGTESYETQFERLIDMAIHKQGQSPKFCESPLPPFVPSSRGFRRLRTFGYAAVIVGLIDGGALWFGLKPTQKDKKATPLESELQPAPIVSTPSDVASNQNNATAPMQVQTDTNTPATNELSPGPDTNTMEAASSSTLPTPDKGTNLTSAAMGTNNPVLKKNIALPKTNVISDEDLEQADADMRELGLTNWPSNFRK